ncbi:transketolase [Candidatus Mycoplasma pogonae]
MIKTINQLAIDTLSINGVAAVNKANSGHPGIVLGAAPILHTLFTKHLMFDPINPTWVNRDRFVLSAGHGSALLYAELRLLNLITQADLENFRQLDSLTPGHPEYGHTKGVEATTGPLGQGIATAVGLAIAEKHLNAKFPEINHYTYVLCGDGDLQEGVANEALSLAGHFQLNKYIVLYDSNDIQLDTAVAAVSTENWKQKVEAMGFDYQLVTEATVEKLDVAIAKAKQSLKPSFIEVKTIIGHNAPKAGTSAVHGAPLGADFTVLKQNLNWTYDDFEVPVEVVDYYQATIFTRGKTAFETWKASPELEAFLSNNNKITLTLDLKANDATRSSSGAVIAHLNKELPNWIGGSADLVSSTKAGGGDGDFSATNPAGRNILFGVREFAMGAIANGLALHSNFKPFVSTFFVFADYLKPAMRLASLMNLPVVYVFTHDSVFVGEDGPTHEPIEQLAMLRSIPNFGVLRPADEKEVLGAYEVALNSTHTPHAIVLTRQNIITLPETSQTKFAEGAYYLIHKPDNKFTLLATGSELALAHQLATELNCNLVSVSNWKQDQAIFWDPQYAISLEAATTFGWGKYAKYNFGFDTFGLSGPGQLVYERLGFGFTNLRDKISKIIK